jgi:hypothetical protein
MKKYLILGTLAVGIVIGASALSALAQSGWQPPQLPPPNGNVPGPINSGSIWQYRLGGISIGTSTQVTPNTPALNVAGGILTDNIGIYNALTLWPNDWNNYGGGSPQGKVLTALDANGTAIWKAPASASGFGAFASKSMSTVYQAATDGFIVGYNHNQRMFVFISSNVGLTPLTVPQWSSGPDSGSTGDDPVVFPVPKGQYWKVTTTGGSPWIYWLPMGN